MSDRLPEAQEAVARIRTELAALGALATDDLAAPLLSVLAERALGFVDELAWELGVIVVSDGAES